MKNLFLGLLMTVGFSGISNAAPTVVKPQESKVSKKAINKKSVSAMSFIDCWYGTTINTYNA